MKRKNNSEEEIIKGVVGLAILVCVLLSILGLAAMVVIAVGEEEYKECKKQHSTSYLAVVNNESIECRIMGINNGCSYLTECNTNASYNCVTNIKEVEKYECIKP